MSKKFRWKKHTASDKAILECQIAAEDCISICVKLMGELRKGDTREVDETAYYLDGYVTDLHCAVETIKELDGWYKRIDKYEKKSS